jgi:hypothetical protein
VNVRVRQDCDPALASAAPREIDEP